MMPIEDVLKEMREQSHWADLVRAQTSSAKLDKWVAVIEQALSVKDAEIERLEEEIEWMREELMKNLQAQAETALNTENK